MGWLPAGGASSDFSPQIFAHPTEAGATCSSGLCLSRLHARVGGLARTPNCGPPRAKPSSVLVAHRLPGKRSPHLVEISLPQSRPAAHGEWHHASTWSSRRPHADRTERCTVPSVTDRALRLYGPELRRLGCRRRP